MSYLWATFSAVSPMLMKAWGKPSALPACSLGFWVSGWSQNFPSGERVLDSTPTHRNAEPSSALMAWKAIRTACSDDEQYRLTVVPGAPTPARIEMIRARLCDCSPPGSAQPQITSSIWLRSSCGTRSSTCLTT